MTLLFFCPRWGSESLGIADFCAKAKAAGYDGVELALPFGDQGGTEAILAAIRKVASGGLYLSERMSGRLLSMFLQGSTGPGDSLIGQLSDREIEVFELIGRGVTTREIAGKLNLSIKTVEAHREHIKKKMKLSDATELLQHAIHWVQNERPI